MRLDCLPAGPPPDCVEGARLCKPKVKVGPSGYRLRHGFDCPARPGEPISAREYAKGRTWSSHGFKGRRR